GDEHGLAGFEAGDATAVVAQVEDVGGERGLVESGHVAKAACTGPRIVADAQAPPAMAGDVARCPTSASSRRPTGTTNPTGRLRIMSWQSPCGSVTPIPGACWLPQFCGRRRARRGSGRPRPC